MKFAVLSTDHTMVENVIVAREDQQNELQVALGRVLIDAGPIGDSAAVTEAIAILEGADDE